MLIPQFIRFYGYTLGDAMNEYAVTFFSLCNDMFRIRAGETIDMASAMNANEEIMEYLREQEKGIAGIVAEVKTAKKVKNK
jgi:hypothetical protein